MLLHQIPSRCGLYSIKLCFVCRHCVTRAFRLSNERNRLSLYDMNFIWNFHEPFYNLNRIDRMPTRKVQFFNSNLSSNQRCGVWAVESSTWKILIPDRHWSTQNHRTCVVFLRNRLVCCSCYYLEWSNFAVFHCQWKSWCLYVMLQMFCQNPDALLPASAEEFRMWRRQLTLAMQNETDSTWQ